jgi:NADPH:quinone reductase-like Zn-dependent oxidoreductase
MKAMVLHELGGPGALRYEDVPEPEPGEGEVVVRLAAAALNRRDLFVTQGLYPGIELPSTPGSDGAGVVAATGLGVDQALSGTEVVVDPALDWGDDPRVPGRGYSILGVPIPGTFAELVKVPAENVFPRPAHLTMEEAAAIPLAGLTAYRALVSRGQVRAGEKVLIPGVGGGVATVLVQMATALGAEAYVTSGSDEKLEAATRLGAAGGVNYRVEKWPAAMKELAGSFDLVLDCVGGPQFSDLLRLTRPGGRIVSIGATMGPVPEVVLPMIFLKQLDVLGTAMGTPAEFAAMLDLFSRHELRPLIARRFPLAEASAALELMESGAAMGKIVLEIATL